MTNQSNINNMENTNGLKIKTEIGDVIFFPTFLISDKLDKPLLHVRFNRKEKLALYFKTEHPDSEKAAETLKKRFVAFTKEYGEEWIVTDIFEYIKEIERAIKDHTIELDNVGIINERKSKNVIKNVKG